jgi:hypothetical protein
MLFKIYVIINLMNKNKRIMTSIALQSLSICMVYGIMSIFQTLNSRYLFRNLNFDFYSFVIQSFNIDIWYPKNCFYCSFLLASTKKSK